MAADNTSKPFVLFCATFPEGHVTPALQICAHLIGNGFDVSITGFEVMRPKVESIGAHLVPFGGMLRNTDAIAHLAQQWKNDEDYMRKLVEVTMVDMLPATFEALRAGLSELNRRDPERKIVIVSDAIYPGTLAYKMLGENGVPQGFKGPVPKTLGLNVVPVMYTSLDSGPAGAALGFDQSDAGRARNKLVAKFMYRDGRDSRTMDRHMQEVLLQYGITRSINELHGEHAKQITHWIADAMFVCHDVTLQMCIPSLEYPYSDLPANIKFGGTLPIKSTATDLTYPDWFNELRENKARAAGVDKKKVVVVAQGTVELDYNLLVIPTITAFADRQDVLVVAILCARGATLDSQLPAAFEGKLPSNVRVLDYFPYDAALQYADVFVTQSGYGGLQHAVANGVPMIQSGTNIDKPEVGLRAEWAGLGIYLWDAPPSPEKVAQAVDKISVGNYKKRALELQEEAVKFNSLAVVEREIMALA